MKKTNKYHKILSVYKRDMENNGKFIVGDWSTDELKYLKDNDWVWTEKVDGTNIRVKWDGKDITFAGRSDEAQIPPFLLSKLQEIFLVITTRKKIMDIFGSSEVVLYGEGYGNKIQKTGKDYQADGNSFVLFDVFIDGLWLERKNVEDIASKFGIDIVPIVGHGTLTEAIELTKKGFNSKWGNFLAEGLVMRPRFELLTRRGERIITKVKHRDFN